MKRYFKKTVGTMLKGIAEVNMNKVYYRDTPMTAQEYIAYIQKKGYVEITKDEYNKVYSYGELAIEYIY